MIGLRLYGKKKDRSLGIINHIEPHLKLINWSVLQTLCLFPTKINFNVLVYWSNWKDHAQETPQASIEGNSNSLQTSVFISFNKIAHIFYFSIFPLLHYFVISLRICIFFSHSIPSVWLKKNYKQMAARAKYIFPNQLAEINLNLAM